MAEIAAGCDARAPGAAPSTLHQVPGTLLDAAAASTAAGSSSGFVNLSSSGFSHINGAINLNLDAVGFASSSGGYTMIATTPAPSPGADGNG